MFVCLSDCPSVYLTFYYELPSVEAAAAAAVAAAAAAAAAVAAAVATAGVVCITTRYYVVLLHRWKAPFNFDSSHKSM